MLEDNFIEHVFERIEVVVEMLRIVPVLSTHRQRPADELFGDIACRECRLTGR